MSEGRLLPDRALHGGVDGRRSEGFRGLRRSGLDQDREVEAGDVDLARPPLEELTPPGGRHEGVEHHSAEDFVLVLQPPAALLAARYELPLLPAVR